MQVFMASFNNCIFLRKIPTKDSSGYNVLTAVGSSSLYKLHENKPY